MSKKCYIKLQKKLVKKWYKNSKKKVENFQKYYINSKELTFFWWKKYQKFWAKWSKSSKFLTKKWSNEKNFRQNWFNEKNFNFLVEFSENYQKGWKSDIKLKKLY